MGSFTASYGMKIQTLPTEGRGHRKSPLPIVWYYFYVSYITEMDGGEHSLAMGNS